MHIVDDTHNGHGTPGTCNARSSTSLMRSPPIGTNTATRHLLAGGPWSWLHPLCCSLGGNSVHRAIVASLDALANQREHGEKQTALTVPVC